MTNLELMKINELLIYILAALYIAHEENKRNRNKSVDFVAASVIAQITSKLGKVDHAEGMHRVEEAIKVAAIEQGVEL